MALKLRPLSIKAANRHVCLHHRHNRPTQGGLFAVGCEDEAGSLVGVAIVGRPVARLAQDGWTCEVTRTCTDGSRNACSLLYGACIRAARALGYHRVITYTLASEPGSSVRAAGFVRDGEVAHAPWTCPSRHRITTDLFGETTVPDGDRVRWVWKREQEEATATR